MIFEVGGKFGSVNWTIVFDTFIISPGTPLLIPLKPLKGTIPYQNSLFYVALATLSMSELDLIICDAQNVNLLFLRAISFVGRQSNQGSTCILALVSVINYCILLPPCHAWNFAAFFLQVYQSEFLSICETKLQKGSLQKHRCGYGRMSLLVHLSTTCILQRRPVNNSIFEMASHILCYCPHSIFKFRQLFNFTRGSKLSLIYEWKCIPFLYFVPEIHLFCIFRILYLALYLNFWRPLEFGEHNSLHIFLYMLLSWLLRESQESFGSPN